MIFYAIRHKPDQLLLPAGGKKFRGHTEQEPSDERPPRLFMSERAAEQALRCYLMGKWRETHTTSYFGECESDGPEPMKDTERNPMYFEVCKVKLYH